MNLCSDNHDEICFEGRICPLCETITEKDAEIDQLNEEIQNLKDAIEEIGNEE